MKTARARNFKFLRRNTHAQRLPHQLEHAASSVFSEEFRKRSGRRGALTEHCSRRRIDAIDFTVCVERQNAGGDIFENRFHKLAAAFDFLERLLEAVCEIVNLLAGLAKLSRHLVEGVDQRAQFVMRARGDAIVKVAAGDLLSGLC